MLSGQTVNVAQLAYHWFQLRAYVGLVIRTDRLDCMQCVKLSPTYCDAVMDFDHRLDEMQLAREEVLQRVYCRDIGW